MWIHLAVPIPVVIATENKAQRRRQRCDIIKVDNFNRVSVRRKLYFIGHKFRLTLPFLIVIAFGMDE